MADVKEFRGQFGDFETLAHDCGIENFTFCSYGPDGTIEAYKMIVGFTQLPYDILLHVIDVENTGGDFDVDTHMEKEGVQLVFLKDFVGKYGVEIHPDFQLGAFNREDTQFD